MVQGNHITPGGRTAAFDGLCCELRGLGMEVTLGQIVDDFSVPQDQEAQEHDKNGTTTKSLEEEFQVSHVYNLENADGTRTLEIPAGDYVPVSKPQAPPIITSITSGKAGGKPRIEMSQEPLFDDIDDSNKTPSFIEAFITDAINNKDQDTQEALEDIHPDDRQEKPQAPLKLSDALLDMSFDSLPSQLSNLNSLAEALEIVSQESKDETQQARQQADQHKPESSSQEDPS